MRVIANGESREDGEAGTPGQCAERRLSLVQFEIPAIDCTVPVETALAGRNVMQQHFGMDDTPKTTDIQFARIVIPRNLFLVRIVIHIDSRVPSESKSGGLGASTS